MSMVPYWRSSYSLPTNCNTILPRLCPAFATYSHSESICRARLVLYAVQPLVHTTSAPCSRAFSQPGPRHSGRWYNSTVQPLQASAVEVLQSNLSPSASGKLESTSLDSGVRQRVQDAIETLRYEVTAGDVAARAGVTVEQAEEALTALAADTSGTLKVHRAVHLSLQACLSILDSSRLPARCMHAQHHTSLSLMRTHDVLLLDLSALTWLRRSFMCYMWGPCAQTCTFTATCYLLHTGLL